MSFVLWATSLFSVLLDNVFKDYFSLTPLYFLLESLTENDAKWKITRIIIFSLFYQSYAFRHLDFLWLSITFVVIVIELYRDVFYYPWSASLLQAALFLIPYYYNYPLTLIYAFTVDFLLFVYIYKKLDFGGV
ncbi:MAG: hypothetical protein ACP5KD_08830 [Fervidobacterium sp.]|jgi:hypothetical protein